MKIIYFSILVFTIITTVFTEMYLGHLGLGDPVRYDSNYIYGYAPKENQKKKRFNNSVLTINDFGLRSNINWNKNKKKKIIFLGDSITYGGSYIDDKKIFSHLVCENLSNYICGNAGVNAYSVINIVMRSRYDERIADAQKYLFLVAPGDFYREYASAKIAHFYLNNNNFFLPAITEAISFVATKYDINKYISKSNDTERNQNKKDLVDYSIKLLNDELIRLKNLNKDIYLIYTVEKDDKNSKKKINKYILEELKKLNIRNFYSLEDVLNKNIYFYDSVHYSEEGHKIVSEKIDKIINANNQN